MRIPVFLAALVATVLLSTGSALAAPPVILAVGQVSQHPTATWSLPTGVEARVVEVAIAPTTGSDGYFFSENVKAFDVPQPTDTSWTYTFQLDPGTYYVHIGGFDTTCGACPIREFSSVLTLVIPAPPAPPPPPPVVATPPVVASATGDGKGLITVTWSLPPGVTSANIQIARDAAVDSLGFFSTASQTDFAALSGTQTSYTSSIPQPPGVYYAHIAGNQPTLGALYVWSAPSVVTIPARTVTGNSSAVIKSRSRTYVADTKRLVRALTACPTLACSFRQVKAFSGKQISFDKVVGKDVVLPAPCGSAARALRSRLRKSEGSTAALQRAIAAGLAGATLKSRAHTAGLQAGRAISAAGVYVAACT
ncbi:MAG: hypothetical protein M3P18_16410 [Actinomycetota bacterium]|nr:hypothetical protein [Actinomycetota bacterium]